MSGSPANAVRASVIVPCCRSGGYLAQFVADLQAQRCGFAWEAVFVDDGSPEPESVYAPVVAAGYRLVRKPHGGTSSARNAGIAASSGEVLLFADPDDRLSTDFVATLVAGIDGVDLAWGLPAVQEAGGGPSADAVPRDAGAVYRGDAVRRRVWDAVFGYRLRDLLRARPGRLFTACRRELGNVCTRAFRREVLGDLRFDESLALYEDAMFLAAYAKRARSMRILGRTGYRYFIRPGGAMSTGNRLRAVEHKFALRDARRLLDPGMTHWRGTFAAGFATVLRRAGWRTAWRYLTFQPCRPEETSRCVST